MTKKTVMGIGMVAAALILLMAVVFFSRGAIRRSINSVRADRLYTKAVEAFESENWTEAAQKGQAAYYLSPEDQDIQLLMARALLYQRNPSTLDWWMLVLDKPDLPVDDLRELTRLLLVARKYSEAMSTLERLVEIDSTSPETQELWLFAMQAQRNTSSSRFLTRKMIEEGSEDWRIHQQYMKMQRSSADSDGSVESVNHLVSLIEENKELALLAARELATQRTASMEKRLIAAAYLVEHGDGHIDHLLGQGIYVREGREDAQTLIPLLEGYLGSEDEDRYSQALGWALWMEAPSLALDRIDWKTFHDNGGPAQVYFNALLTDGRFREALNLSQTEYSETAADSISFLVARAAAYRGLGDDDEADATLEHAVQIVDPEQSRMLETYLINQSKWELLLQLYKNLTDENPENASLMLRYLTALYYTGDQEVLTGILEDVDMELFEGMISGQAFLSYLKLIINGFTAEQHYWLEKQLDKYPEVYDFRLIVGLSYLLQQDMATGQSFTEGMPELAINAPRHLRVCAAALQNSMLDRFSPGELEYLLPRERFLLSHISSR